MAESISLNGILEVRSDGSVHRTGLSESVLEKAYPDGKDGVASKDVSINQELGIWARIYLPASLLNSTSSAVTDKGQLLPVVVYSHGGGFYMCTPADQEFDTLCNHVAKKAGVLVVSVNYRLAPEFRLPTAYEDTATALRWISTHRDQEEWLSRYGDMDAVFLMGDSSGGNIVHHVIARAADGAYTWEPLNIRGLILLQPFFGGEERTESERVLGQKGDNLMKLKRRDCVWSLALPFGCNRDHPFCNIWIGDDDVVVDVFMKKNFPSALVMVGGEDMLKDGGLRYAEDLKRSGKTVELIVYEEEDHFFYYTKGDSSPNFHDLISRISEFVSKNPNPLPSF